MLKNKAVLLFVLVTTVVITPSSVLGNDIAKESKRTWKVGIAVPLSGTASWLGQNILDGVKLYSDQIPNPHVKIIVEDTTTESLSKGVSAVKKLLATDNIDALILANSQVANAVSSDIDRKKVPTIAITGDDSAKGRTFIVKLWMPALNEARTIEQLIIRNNVKTMAIVTSEQDSMLARSNALKSILSPTLTVSDFPVVSGEEISAYAVKIASTRPDMVVMNLMPGLYGNLARRLKELDYKGVFVGSPVMAHSSERENAGKAFDGAYYVDAVINPDFVKRYRAKFANYPGLAVANGHDAMKILNEAFASVAENSSANEINQAIRRKGFSGAMGKYSFEPNINNIYNLPAKLTKLGDINAGT